jgi:hypothetical protein
MLLGICGTVVGRIFVDTIVAGYNLVWSIFTGGKNGCVSSTGETTYGLGSVITGYNVILSE